MRLVFLGSPPFATPVLARVLDSAHEVLALVTRPDRPRGRGKKVEPSELVALAAARRLPVLQPANTRDEGFLAELRALDPEVLLVASFGEILRRPILELAPHGALNVHASLLPRHRGASPIQAAILAGDERTGVSIQRIVLALDEGDVLHERDTPIGPRETAGELFERLAALGGEAAVEALDALAGGAARFRPQDPARATYAHKLAKADGALRWGRPAEELDRHVRAMTPWPGARCVAPGGTPLVVAEARAPEASELEPETRARLAAAAPGALVELAPRCLVATGAGALELVRVQPAGKRAMPAADWLRGARLALDRRLEDGA